MRRAHGKESFPMLGLKGIRSTRRQALGRAFLIGVAGVFAPALAHAHFILVTPDSWMSQDTFGLPEKLGPCGDEGGGMPTGKVTAFHPGQTISVTIAEVIAHPGHYRVALAVNDRSELPAEPDVMPKGNDPCGSAAIQYPPTFPILADNVLPHTQPFGGPQTFTVTLPMDVTCTKCTLQVLEFMSLRRAAPPRRPVRVPRRAASSKRWCGDRRVDPTPFRRRSGGNSIARRSCWSRHRSVFPGRQGCSARSQSVSSHGRAARRCGRAVARSRSCQPAVPPRSRRRRTSSQASSSLLIRASLTPPSRTRTSAPGTPRTRPCPIPARCPTACSHRRPR